MYDVLVPKVWLFLIAIVLNSIDLNCKFQWWSTWTKLHWQIPLHLFIFEEIRRYHNVPLIEILVMVVSNFPPYFWSSIDLSSLLFYFFLGILGSYACHTCPTISHTRCTWHTTSTPPPRHMYLGGPKQV